MRRLSQLYFNFAKQANRHLNSRIHMVARRLLAAQLPGITDVIPSYTSLHVEYDPALIGGAQIRALVLSGMESHDSAEAAGRVVEVEAVYDGPDLQKLAAAVGLSPEEVVMRHTGTDYLAYAVGFTPGFAFLGDVDESIRKASLGKPRAAVPAGSVGIAEGQTGIYPLNSTGRMEHRRSGHGAHLRPPP